MTTRVRARLAELKFPIAEVSQHAMRKEIDPPWAAASASPVVGVALSTFSPGSVLGIATAEHLRSARPDDVQVKGSAGSLRKEKHNWLRLASISAWLGWNLALPSARTDRRGKRLLGADVFRSIISDECSGRRCR